MSHILDVPVNQGYVSTGEKATSVDGLDSGELTEMSGVFYRKNDPEMAWKMPGRSTFGDAGSGGIKGLSVCQFDDDSGDLLVALIGTTLVSATPGLTGTFSTLVTGLNDGATSLTACHHTDRWYLGNGIDQNIVLKPDGTTRAHGLQAPVGQLSMATASISTLIWKPSSSSGVWSQPMSAADMADATITEYDSSLFTFAHVNPTIANISYTQDWSGFTADATSGRRLRINWSASVGARCTFYLYMSTDGGSNWTTILERAFTAPFPYEVASNWLEADLTEDNSTLSVRATVVWNGTTLRDVFELSGLPIQVRINDIRVEYGSPENETASTGLFYAFTEVCSPEGGIESPPSQIFGPMIFTNQSQVTVTRPAITNPAATHWRVYRVPDGSAPTIDNLGLVSDDIDIALASWIDRFDVSVSEQSTPIVPILSIGDLSFPRDTPPQPFVSMIAWKGSICGISSGNTRQWYYSEADLPESFPAPYTIVSFPLDEHDRLVGQMAVGETLVLLCEGAAIAIDDLPRVTDGQYNNADARPLKGHPGCVGIYAFTTFSVVGEPRGAWVSPFGVYVTNGTICECISTDLSWTREVNVPYLSTAVLRWDADNFILWFEFDLDGDGLNDREMPFHMAEVHQKKTGKPKIGQPTAKATSCIAQAIVDSSYLRYSGHPSDGNVYLENSGTVDAATGSEVVSTVKTGELSGDMINASVVKVTVNHSDFGSGATGTLVGTFYRDTANTSNSRSQTVRLDGDRGTTVGMGRAGESFDLELSYSGSGVGGIGGFTLEIEGQGRAGSAPRVTSSSATP